MNKNTYILILVISLLALGTLTVYLFFFQKTTAEDTPIQELSLSKIIRELNYSHLEDISKAETSFINAPENPLHPSDAEYEELFGKAERIVSFSLKYPKELSDFKLVQITAWRDQTQAMFAYYENDSGKQFIIQGITEFYPEEFGIPLQEFILKNGKFAQLWDFQFPGEEVTNYVLLFDTSEIRDVPVYHVVESMDLSPKELVEIANSSL